MPRKTATADISPPATPVRKSSRAVSKTSTPATGAVKQDKALEEAVTNETPNRSIKRKRAAVTYDEDSDSEVDGEVDAATSRKKTKKSPQKPVKVEKRKEVKADDSSLEVKQEIREEVEEPAKSAAKGKGRKSKATKVEALKADGTKVEEEAKEQTSQEADGTVKKATKRKTKAEKQAEMQPLAARTTPFTHRIGAHVSAAGGVQECIPNALRIGANAFACFLKSQRKWDNPALKDEHRDAWHTGCKDHSYDANVDVVPHGSYLVNLASADDAMATKAYTSFLDDLRRCEALGIKHYNFHPGNSNGTDRASAIDRLANNLNRAIAETKTVIPLLENMAANPEANTIGGSFSDLADVIALIKDKSRIGVCLDTCHAFAAGYDIRSPDAYAKSMDDFEKTVGFKYLKALHMNDSKGVLGSHRDLHQNIGLGFIGLRGFWNVMNDERLRGLPMVLETPIDVPDAGKLGKTVEDKGVWVSRRTRTFERLPVTHDAREIKLLESLVGMDPEGEEFKRLEAELAEKGAAERKKLQDQFDKKQSSPKKKGKGKKKAETSDESE